MAHEEQGGRRGYEVKDVNLRFLTGVVIGFFLLLLIGMSVSLWYENAMLERREALDTPASPLANTLPALPPEPRLQVVPGADVKKLHGEEDAVLENYAWVDAKSGIVRIPIDRAMELVAERGLPARAESASAAPTKETKKEGKHGTK